MTTATGGMLDLDITGIAHGGIFVARHEGRVVFVSDALPGERVRARLREEDSGASRSFWRADTVEVLEASPHRVPHIWREADVSRDPAVRPGGADLGHIELGHQRVLKRQVLTEALDRFAGVGLEAPEVSAVDDSDGRGWRTRLTLHVDEEGRIGPYAARSHNVIDVSSHPLATDAIAERALSLRGAAGRIDLVQPADGRVHVLRTPLQGRKPKRETVHEVVAGRRFAVDAGGFWQVHRQAATVLDDAVRGLLNGRMRAKATNYDLYGGVGLLAAAMHGAGARNIVTVESNKRATAHAASNLESLRVRAVTGRVDRFLAGVESAGVIVLDPPRSGAGRTVVEHIDRIGPDAVLYVACDPVALARDLGTFRGLGWHVRTLEAYDLFPHSHHFETVALLTR